MSILGHDGFGFMPNGSQIAGTDTDLIGEMWTGFGQNFSISDEGDGRKWVKNNGSRSHVVMQTYTWSGVTTIWIAFRFYADVWNGAGQETAVVWFMDGSSRLGQLGIDDAGKIIYSTDPTERLDIGIVHTGNGMTAGQNNHVEVKLVFHGSTGSVTVYVNGAQDSETTSIDTINAGTSCTNLRWFPEGYPTDAYYGIPDNWKFTDLVWHSEASAQGDLGSFYMEPEEDGTNADFTPSSGSDHFEMVNDIGSDEDSTYNESDGTSGHKDDYGFTSTVTANNIIAVTAHLRARKTDVGTAQIKAGIIHSASEDQSAAKSLTDSYQNFFHITETNPSTASQWEDDEIDDAFVSIEVV